MKKPVANEVNIVSKRRSVIADVDDDGSVNKHGGATPKHNQEVSLITVIQNSIQCYLSWPISNSTGTESRQG